MRLLRLGLWRRRGQGLRVRIVLLLLRALVELLRHALLEARHTVGENRLAFARQLLLGVEPVEKIGWIEIASEAA